MLYKNSCVKLYAFSRKMVHLIFIQNNMLGSENINKIIICLASVIALIQILDEDFTRYQELISKRVNISLP